MFDYIKNTNTSTIAVSKKAKKDRKGSQNIYDKLMSEKSPDLRKKENSGTRNEKSPPKMITTKPLQRYSN